MTAKKSVEFLKGQFLEDEGSVFQLWMDESQGYWAVDMENWPQLPILLVCHLVLIVLLLGSTQRKIKSSQIAKMCF